jgi:hypothetical protein
MTLDVTKVPWTRVPGAMYSRLAYVCYTPDGELHQAQAVMSDLEREMAAFDIEDAKDQNARESLRTYMADKGHELRFPE